MAVSILLRWFSTVVLKERLLFIPPSETAAMALVLANVVTLKPESDLVQALRDYEAILTDEQKIQFRSQNGSPGAPAAISFTFDIDRENSSRRNRCVGARLMTFLESVQQFTSIIDTFVSSKPNIAALIWGGVKLALLVISHLPKYFSIC